MNNTIQAWLAEHYPEVLKEWNKFFKNSRRDYMRKWQKDHYISVEKRNKS